jgi:hypothetical protein
MSIPTTKDRRHLKVSKPPSPLTDPRGEPPPPTGFHRVGPPPHALRVFTVLLGQSPLSALHRSFPDDRSHRRTTPSSPHRRPAPLVSPRFPSLARWVALTSPVLLSPLSPHLVPGSAAGHPTADAALGTVTAPGTRSRDANGPAGPLWLLGRVNSFRPWAESAAQYRYFFPIMVFIYLNSRKSIKHPKFADICIKLRKYEVNLFIILLSRSMH